MQKIRIVAIGKVKEKYLLEGIVEYEKRLRPYCKLEWVEIRDLGMKEEAMRLGKYIGDGTYILDVEGKETDSVAFANFIKARGFGQTTFIIGSADGISPGLKKGAKLISLSRMTFTHDMCRLFLIEQIYRACMIINNRSYHK
ncbi:MAG: 23S rRNA (pseudouridine(1915)-N(3))-methyltransferase RlmH [Candidatus Micrarchaeia archaeon]